MNFKEKQLIKINLTSVQKVKPILFNTHTLHTHSHYFQSLTVLVRFEDGSEKPCNSKVFVVLPHTVKHFDFIILLFI